MPTVALVCEHPTLNGGEQSALATLPGLAAEGFEILAIAPPAGPLADAFSQAGIRVIGFQPSALAHSSWRGTARHELARLLRGCSPDLVHANSLSIGRLTGPVARELGLPAVCHLRDIVKLSRPAVSDLNLHQSLLAVSHAARDFHAGQGLDAARMHVLYNGVDLQTFRPRPPTGWLHRQLALPSGALLVGAIGQIILRKGYDVLAAAAAALADLAHVHWIIAGSRYSTKPEALRHEQRVRHLFADGGLAGRVHFLGHIPRIDALLSELALLVHPARQEPLGRVLLEAAASQLPIVASDVGGTREIFPPDQSAACLIAPGDSRQLGDAIRRLLANPAQRTVMAHAARRRAEQAFDIRLATGSLAKHYRRLAPDDRRRLS